MFRSTQTVPGGGITLLGILGLSFLLPGWVTGALGWAAPHAHLLAWMARQEGLMWLSLWLFYGLSGFGLLLAGIVAVCATGLVLLRGLAQAQACAVRAIMALAPLLGALLFWPAQILGELLSEAVEVLTARWRERCELRQIYRTDYARDFPSFRAFLRYWRAIERGDPNPWGKPAAPAPDPLAAAIRLMGLPKTFTTDELKQRFHTLIDGIHPDRVGPNELATQLIAAYQLIRNRNKRT